MDKTYTQTHTICKWTRHTHKRIQYANGQDIHTNAYKHTMHAAKVVDWKLGMTAAEQTQTVKMNNVVVFNWEGLHNVYMFASKSAFDSCNFAGAVKVGTESPFVYKPSSSGVFYFGCQIGKHCAEKQKLALTVTGMTTYTHYVFGRRSVC